MRGYCYAECIYNHKGSCEKRIMSINKRGRCNEYVRGSREQHKEKLRRIV